MNQISVALTTLFFLMGCGTQNDLPTAKAPPALQAPKSEESTPTRPWESHLAKEASFNVEELHQALREGAFEDNTVLLQTLTRTPAALTWKDEQGQTLAHWLVSMDNVPLMKMLLQTHRSESLEILDDQRRSPLHLLHSAAMTQLLFASVKAEAWATRDWKGQTPLHALAERGDENSDQTLGQLVTKICQGHSGWMSSGFKQWLKDQWNGNELNFADGQGRTPLHWATIANSRLGAEALIRCRAVDLSLEDDWRRNALHYATVHSDFTIGYAILARAMPLSGKGEHEARALLDINAIDAKGMSALRLSNRLKNNRAINTLTLFGASETTDQ